MRKLRINIVLPFISTRAGGGSRIMYEYANRLASRGHKVRVLHSIQRPFRRIKSPLWWKQFLYKMRGLSSPPWFKLEPGVESRVVPEIVDRFVPDADITISTWWEMAYMISRLSPAKGLAFNLIQDYEVWKGYEKEVLESYSLPIHHLVIARYLQELVKEQTGATPNLLPNAIDQAKFTLSTSLTERPPKSVIMMYSEEPRKGTQYGIQGLEALKLEFPSMTADVFGVYEKPAIPAWISYHRKPVNLADLFNRNAVFMSPSLGEGWALPPAEAMSCGCAVVCTNIGGHADYAFDEKTGLLFEPRDVKGLVQQMRRLFEDEDLGIKLAARGNQFINENFRWENSVTMLENFLYETIGR